MAEPVFVRPESLSKVTTHYCPGCTHGVAHRLVAEEGGFLYNADSYADDLPYWDRSLDQPQLMVPYTLDANDMRFATAQGFNTGRQFYRYLKDTFRTLHGEGQENDG